MWNQTMGLRASMNFWSMWSLSKVWACAASRSCQRIVSTSSSVAVSFVTRVMVSAVWWKTLKGGGGTVGRGGVVACTAFGAGAGGGVELQPRGNVSASAMSIESGERAMSIESGEGATLYQHGAKPHERVRRECEG